MISVTHNREQEKVCSVTFERSCGYYRQTAIRRDVRRHGERSCFR